MPVVSDRVFAYARSQFEASIRDLLDDPSHLLHPWRDLEPVEELTEQRKLAADLGFDFDALVALNGTEYERQRLADIESGKIKPQPREALEDWVTRLGTKKPIENR